MSTPEQNRLREIQAQYTSKQKPKSPSPVPSVSTTPRSKTYFWPSFWSGLGLALAASVLSGFLAAVLEASGSGFTLYVAAVVGAYLWWKKRFEGRFSNAGYWIGVLSLWIVQLILALIFFFVLLAGFVALFS